VVGQRLWRHDPATSEETSWKVQAPLGSIALCRSGEAILAMGKGFHRLDFRSGRTTELVQPEAGVANTQFNDGKTDRHGRFLAGTLVTGGAENVATLYSINTNGDCAQLDNGFRITNGPCWSPDGRTFYLADSPARTIFAYDYDLTHGTVGNRRKLVDTTPFGGVPDGATVDAKGNIWSAQCLAGLVLCYDPNGKVVRRIDCPTDFVSSVMFGGDDLERLYVTSIDPRSLPQIAPERIASNELGGQLFVIDGLGSTGLPEPYFGG
jgi:sugar lactone lactonase YvrE